MDAPKAHEVVSVTVRLPRGAWPKELRTSARDSTAVSLVRGRWTSRQAVVLIRVEGSLHEIRSALRSWVRRGLSVEECGGPGAIPGIAI